MRRTWIRWAELTAGLIVLLAGAGVVGHRATAAKGTAPADVTSELAAVHNAFAGFDTTAKAQAGGWDLQPGLDSCFENPGVGAMGFHYINPNLLDTTFDPLKPEAIVYEPLPGGAMKLAAVEYIVPAGAWEKTGSSGVPQATALGQPFHLNQALGVYVLHAWVFKDNPAGVFEDWNPTVSCASAAGGGHGHGGGDGTAVDPAAQLAAVHEALAGFDTTQKAQSAGWSLQPGLDSCFDNPGVGGMGYHYINPALLDTSFEVMKPEALVFQPLAGGGLKLGAIEYIIPAAAWDKDHSGPPEAAALGQHFHLNEALGVYVLHAWIFKDNAAGVFQDWNPSVSCVTAPNPPNTGSGPPER